MDEQATGGDWADNGFCAPYFQLTAIDQFALACCIELSGARKGCHVHSSWASLPFAPSGGHSRVQFSDIIVSQDLPTQVSTDRTLRSLRGVPHSLCAAFLPAAPSSLRFTARRYVVCLLCEWTPLTSFSPRVQPLPHCLTPIQSLTPAAITCTTTRCVIPVTTTESAKCQGYHVQLTSESSTVILPCLAFLPGHECDRPASSAASNT